MAKGIKGTHFNTWSAHWRNGLLLSSKLSMNAFNFLVQSTEYAENFFKKSFDKGRFNQGKDGKWKPRKKHYNHPILKETGELRDSIRRTRPTSGNMGLQSSVRTNEKYGNRRGKKSPSYAAVHNEGGYWSNQYRSSRSTQRQFMGHNEYLYNQIAKRFLRTLRKGIL